MLTTPKETMFLGRIHLEEWLEATAVMLLTDTDSDNTTRPNKRGTVEVPCLLASASCVCPKNAPRTRTSQ